MSIKSVKFVGAFYALFISMLSYSGLEDLELGEGVNGKNIYDISSKSDEYATAYSIHSSQKDRGVLAFYLEPKNNNLFSLSPRLNLYLTDYSSKNLVTSRELKKWEYMHSPVAVQSNYSQYNTEHLLDRFHQVKFPRVGCFNLEPMRYGDFDEDGFNEVILYLSNDLVVFSPKYDRIVYAESLDSGDWASKSMTQEVYAEYGRHSKNKFQYLSSISADNSQPGLVGVRAYTKIYLGDFDFDGSKDVLAWRKVYKSRSLSDSVNGFVLIKDEFRHYERDFSAQKKFEKGATGEYLPQPTKAEVVEQWLLEKELSWAKGFPRFSECPGVEGQLIPEMHDGLLNDTQVLESFEFN